MVSAAKDPLTFDELMATPIDFSKFSMSQLKLDHLTQEILIGPTDLIRTIQKEIVTPFDLTKPLPLKGRPGHLTVTAEYLFNNDLELLKSSDPEKNYTTSITKTKAARYKISGIEDMVPTLWSPIKYGADQQLYKFKEGDFVDLHLNNIEDMPLLVAQHKLFHLDGSDIVDFIVALHVTLKIVRDELHHRILDFRLGYNKEMSRRKWMATDKRRSELMVELINKQMLERRIIRNLKRLVGARELKMDYKLMTRTV
ncbi:hypothetical protein Tco_0199305 [Tanacetum coccineum]